MSLKIHTKQNKVDSIIYHVWNHLKCFKLYNSHKSLVIQQYDTSHVSAEGHVHS